MPNTNNASGISENVNEVPYPLANQVVFRDGDKLTIGDVPTDEQKAALESFRSDWFGGNAMFTDEPIKRGDTWVVKPEVALEAIFGETFTNGTGKVSMAVTRITDYDNQEAAEITMSLDHCKGTSTSPDGGEMEVEVHGFGTLYRSVDPQHTIHVDLNGDVHMTLPQPDAALKFSGPFECRASSEVTLP